MLQAIKNKLVSEKKKQEDPLRSYSLVSAIVALVWFI